MRKLLTFFVMFASSLGAAETAKSPSERNGTSITIFLAGAVKTTGKRQLKVGSKAWDAIEAAGGLVPGYSARRAKLTRHQADGSVRVFELDLRMKDASKDNLALQDSDVIHIPEHTL